MFKYIEWGVTLHSMEDRRKIESEFRDEQLNHYHAYMARI